MREVTEHQTNECNRQIRVLAGEPGVGGAPVRYDIFGPERQTLNCGPVARFGWNLRFQNGPIADGVDGLTNEVLLAIVMDRLRAFQAGPFKSDYNEAALRSLDGAMLALTRRTRSREARGVEGTHTP